MLRHLLWLCGLPLLLLAAEPTIYRWQGADGVVHYGDHPPAGVAATPLEVNVTPPQPLPMVPTPKTIASASSTSVTVKPIEVVSYQITITRPVAEETLRDNGGALLVVTEINPKPMMPFRLKLLVDDQAVAEVANSLQLGVEDIDRGEHFMRVQMLNESGAILAISESVRFYLHRAHQPILRVNPLAK